MEQSQHMYHVMFLDLHMPVMDGFQAARTLRESHASGVIDISAMKIVALSAITEEQFKHNPNSSDYFDHFSKFDNIIIYLPIVEKPVNFIDL